MTNRRRWTEKEEEYLREFALDPRRRSISEVARNLKRTKNSINQKLSNMRKKEELNLLHKAQWTEEDDDYLVMFSESPDKDEIKDVAQFLGRTEDAVVSRLVILRKDNKYVGYLKRKWTPEEDKIITHSKGNVTYKELAEKLNRTEAAIMLRVQNLGIANKITHPEKLKGLDFKIREMAENGHTRREIADETGLEYKVIKNYLLRNKIKCRYADHKVNEHQRKIMSNIMRHATRRY